MSNEIPTGGSPLTPEVKAIVGTPAQQTEGMSRPSRKPLQAYIYDLEHGIPSDIRREGLALGCYEEGNAGRLLHDEMVEAAVSINSIGIGTGQENLDTNARTIKFDDDLLNLFDTYGKYVEAMWRPAAGKPVCCDWHWVIAEKDGLPTGLKLVPSQENIGSCCSHAAENAAQLSTIRRRAIGVPTEYTEMNRIATWYASKGDSMRGGQILAYMADYMTRLGRFPASLVGGSVTAAPTKYKQFLAEATQHQCYVTYIPWEQNRMTVDQVIDVMFAAGKAGFHTEVGNTIWPTGSNPSSTGLKLPVFGGGGGHATEVGDWRPPTVRRTSGQRLEEALFFGNSHGGKYTAISEPMEPNYGMWLTRQHLRTYLQTAKPFGGPIIYLPEVTLRQRPSFDEATMYRYLCPVEDLEAL